MAFDADPNSGVAVYDSYDYGSSTPWVQVGGTSLSSPCWAGLIAIADQLRVAEGLTPMDGPSQTLPILYGMQAGDFHDITVGNNGYAAGPGYDMVTGIGSPVANNLVPDFTRPAVSAGNAGAVTFIRGGAAIAVAPNLTLTDPNYTNLASATVSLSGGPLDATAETLAATTAGTSITAGYNGTTGVSRSAAPTPWRTISRCCGA